MKSILKGLMVFVALLLLSVSLVSARFFPDQLTGDLITARAVLDPDAESETVKEVVKCVFFGSNQPRTCKSDAGSCTGIESCLINIRGPSGQKMVWKSTCPMAGPAMTVTDGTDEYVEFKCGSYTTESVENVRCVFVDAPSAMKCAPEGKEGCIGSGSCTKEVSGKTGSKLVWKSNCPGSEPQSTVIDGTDQTVKFRCGANIGKVTSGEKGDQMLEAVTCVFESSPDQQGCSSPKGGCKGVGSCVVKVAGSPGQKVEWRSSCAKAQVVKTLVDGKDESVSFGCAPIGKKPVQSEKRPLPEKPCLDGEYRLTNKKEGHYFGAQKCVAGVWSTV